MIEAVLLHAVGDQRRIGGPHAAVVEAHGVVGARLLAHRADPPAGEHVPRHEALDHCRHVLVGHDAGPQGVADRRAHRPHLPLAAVERHREVALVLHPEAFVEELLERAGLPREPLGALDVAELTVDRGEAALGVVHVALRLGQGDRPFGHAAVAVQHGVAGIPPALVAQPGARAALVFDEAVAVEVAALVQPLERRVDRVAAVVEAVEVAGPHRELRHEQQPERCGVDRPVVRRVRDGAHAGQLPAPQLVHDLARLLLAEGTVLPALAALQKAHRRLRPAQVEEERLETDEHQLAPERRREPRHAGHGDALAVDLGRQHAQVVLPAAHDLVDQFVVGEDVGGARVPALVLVTHRRELGAEVACARLGGARRDDLDVVTDREALAGRDPQAPARPALLDRLGRVAEGDDRLAQHLVKAEVGERQRILAGLGGEARAALAPPQAAHLEEVGEVGVEVQVDHQLDLGLVEVAHAQQLVEPVGNEPGAAHVHGRLRQRAPVRHARLQVGELDRGGVAALRRGREQHRLAAGDGELVAAEVARVLVVEAEDGVLAAGHLPQRVGIEEEVAFLDGEARRAPAAHHVALGARRDDALVVECRGLLLAHDEARGALRAFGTGALGAPGLVRRAGHGVAAWFIGWIQAPCDRAARRRAPTVAFLPRRLDEQAHGGRAIVADQSGRGRLALFAGRLASHPAEPPSTMSGSPASASYLGRNRSAS